MIGFYGAKGGGGGSFKQRPDTLRSTDTFEGLLGLCAGPIKGLTRGLKSLKIDGTPLEDESGKLNFENFVAIFANGDPTAFPQQVDLRLGAGGSPVAVNLQLSNTNSSGPGPWITKSIANQGADFLDLRFLVNQLYRQDKKGIYEHTANLEIQLKPTGATNWISPMLGTPSQTYEEAGSTIPMVGGRLLIPRIVFDGGGYYKPETNLGYFRIYGKTSSVAVHELRLTVPNDGDYENVGWDVRCRLIEKESVDDDPNFEKRNITWESVSAGYNTKLGVTEPWRGLSWLQLYGKASDQLTGIPSVEGEYDTLIVPVPPSEVFDPETREYTGEIWDGSWARAFTTDPAWNINGLISDALHGMALVSPGAHLNKWDALEASKWFSEQVPDGAGGTEPRYSLNAVINEPQKASEFVPYLAGAVGALAWEENAGEWRLKVDKPETPSDLFTLEAIEGEFRYSHTNVDTRFNDITMVFLNKEFGYREDRVRVVDSAHIARFGRKPTTVVAIGCTGRQEALRRAIMRLRVATRETRMVTFVSNRRGKMVRPLSTILVADGDLGTLVDSDENTRSTGRIVSIAPDRMSITVRDPLRLELGVAYSISFAVPNPDYAPDADVDPQGENVTLPTVTQTVSITNDAAHRGNVTTIYLSSALPASVAPNANIALSANGLPALPKQYRVTSVSVEGEKTTISAIEIDTGKWDASDSGVAEEGYVPPIDVVVPPVLNATITTQGFVSDYKQNLALNVNWDRPGAAMLAGYRTEYRVNGAEWVQISSLTSLTSIEIINPQFGNWEFRITAIDRMRRTSEPVIVSKVIDETLQPGYYGDGTPIEDLKPAEPGATDGATAGDNLKDSEGNPLGDADIITSEGISADTFKVGGVLSEDVLGAISTAQDEIDDLILTYGDTASAAASAALAETAAENAETAKTQAEAARTAAQTAQSDAAANQAAAEAAQAGSEAAKLASEAAKTASETARNQAQTYAGNAGDAATAAAGHASTASTKATEAGNSAAAAAASVIAAEAQADDAADSAQAAATSESNAATFAGDAEASATSATTAANNASVSKDDAEAAAVAAAASASAAAASQTAAGSSASAASEAALTAQVNAATRGLVKNGDFSAGLNGWYNYASSSDLNPPPPQTTHEETYEGASGVLVCASDVRRNLMSGRFEIDPERKYRLRGRIFSSNHGATHYLGIQCRDADDVYLGVKYATVAQALPEGWSDFVSDVITGATATTAVWSAGGFHVGTKRVSMIIFANYSYTVGQIIAFDNFYLEDVTESENAAAAASAASTSASNAAASASDAEDFAGAATSAANTATTKAGEASTYAGQAATSAADAEGFKNTASSQATLAAAAKDDAETAASAAASSASVAATKATEAGDFATSASTSANNASIAKDDAEDAANAAANSATAAAASQTAAGTSASAASSAALTAQVNAATQGLTKNGDFSAGVSGWFNNYVSNPNTAPPTPLTAATNWNGAASVALNESGARRDMRGSLAKIIPGHKYRVRFRYWSTTAPLSITVGVMRYDASSAPQGSNHVFSVSSPSTNQWVERSELIPDAALAGYAQMAPYALTNLGAVTGEVAFDYLYIEDVTEVESAAASAAAASESESSAAASQSGAEAAASAASSSANTATTAAGTATTKASEAATSASNAEGFKNTASTQASLAASSATAAQKAAQATLPSTFEDGTLYFKGSNANANPTNVTHGVDPTYGAYFQVVNQSANATVATRGRVPCKVGQRFKVRALVQHVSGTPGRPNIRIEQFAAPSGGTQLSVVSATLGTVTSTTPVWVGDDTILTATVDGFIDACVALNYLPSPQDAIQRVYALELIDVDVAEEAAGSASAAASSATVASTQAGQAGVSAAAAATSELSAKATAAAKGLTKNADFSAGLAEWYNGYTSALPTGTGPATFKAETDWNGAAYAAVNDFNARRDMRGSPTPIIPGRQYRIRMRYWASMSPVSITAGVMRYDASGAAVGGTNHVFSLSSSPTNQWVERDDLVDSATLVGYAQMAPYVLSNLGAVAGTVAFDYFYIEDVTESETAKAQANIATSQAVVATSQAAAAQESAILSASIGGNSLNANNSFAAWTGSRPDGWDGGAATKGAGRLSPNAAVFTAAAGANAFLSQTIGGGTVRTLQQGDWVVLEGEAELLSGNTTGAGVAVNVLNSAGSTVQTLAAPFPAGATVGVVYNVRKLFQVTSATAFYMRLLACGHLTSLGSVAAANSVRFYNCKVRYATESEIRDQTVLAPMEATVSTQASTLATHTTQLASLDTTVSAQGATISTQQTALNGLATRYSVTLSVNGHVTGFQQNNNGTSGDFVVQADKFMVAMPGVTPRVVFGVNASGALINGDLYVNNGKIIADTGTYMKVIGKGFGTSNQFIEWFGPKMALNLCSESNAITYIKTNGDAYFGGALTSGVLKNGATSSSIAPNASADTGTFGSNGGAIVVTVSWTYEQTWFSEYAGTTPAATAWVNKVTEITGVSPGSAPNVEWTGNKTVSNSTLTLARKVGTGSLTNVQSAGTTSMTVHLVGDKPSVGNPGYLQAICTSVISFTYTDNTKNTSDRQFVATLARATLNPGLDQLTQQTQRISVNAVEE